ncbi:MAG: SMC-Scp complex subunit ScpB [Phycisphaerales bacterium]|nr:SMC-Scp complex subunit ScpB [Phycisphaerales bacterium]
MSNPTQTPTDLGATGEAGSDARADGSLPAMLEAILLCADRPTLTLRLAEAAGLVREEESDGGETAKKVLDAERDAACERVERAIGVLNADLAATGRTFRVEKRAGGWRVMTLPTHAAHIAAFQKARLASKLSRQAVETLAIVAYKQPITRAQLEAIRGVSCGEVLRSLIERRLVTVTGRAEELGRPLLYGTSRQFLDQFGLASINDLPTLAELKPIGV